MASYVNQTGKTEVFPSGSIRKIDSNGDECLSDHLLPGEVMLFGDGRIDPQVTTAPSN